jgi:plastocyanin
MLESQIMRLILNGCIALLLIVSTTTPYTAEARELQIVINGIAFMPEQINAKVSDRIKWTNNDGVRHEIFFAKNPTVSGAAHLRYQLNPGESASIIVTKPGDYDYMCRWHGMLGSIHIE